MNRTQAAWRNGTIAGLLSLAIFAASPVLAVPPSDTLLPNTTAGYVSVPDVKVLEEHWDQTQLGQLMKDPVMGPFGDDLARQLKSRFTRIQNRLGLTLEDLEGVPGGELAIAIIRPKVDDAAIAVLVDVTDHLDRAEELLAKIDANMKERKATKKSQVIGDVTATVYTIPRESAELEAATAVFFLHENLLCGTDSIAITEDIVRRAASEEVTAGVLKNNKVYQEVIARSAKDAGELAPHVRWFIDPIAYASAVRTIEIRRGGTPPKDAIEKIAGIGFDAIQGLGGSVNFYVDEKYEMLHRTAIYAPPVNPSESSEYKYESAARMLAFPNSGNLTPQSWVPRELAAYITFNWDIQTAFDSIDPLADEIFGQEGSWKTAINSIKEEEYGPKVDIRNELVAHLGQRVTLLTDYEVPITPNSERRLLAIEAKNEARLAATLEKMMKSDAKAHRREHGKFVVWEIVEQEELIGDFNDLFQDPTIAPVIAPEPVEARKLSQGAFAVAHGHIFASSHIEFLLKVLDDIEERRTLAKSPDYQIVMTELDKLVPGDKSFRTFSRTDEEYRPTYELIRQGRMPESRTIFGIVLNALFGEGEEEMLRQQQIDGHNLPDFDVVRRYFGPAGLAIQTEENGWSITGFTLSK